MDSTTFVLAIGALIVAAPMLVDLTKELVKYFDDENSH